MKGFLAIFRRELSGLFFAPLAWVLLLLTLFYQAFFFLLYLEASGGEVNLAISWILGGTYSFWYLVLFLPPLVTMRMISEETRSGLLEYLLTSPVGDAAVVVGKAAAATSFFAVLWSATFLYGLLCQYLGAAPDWGVLFTAWLGATAVSALFCSLGLLWSALTSTPLLAAFLALLSNLTLVFLVPLLGRSLRGYSRATVDAVVEKIDVVSHLQSSFLRGVLDSGHVVFFVAWTCTLLFLTVRKIESRRWLG
ncbi:MAG: ABC-2 type transport system permease protein [Planctomycetota bacterium]|jgi:ABC-2 type transport system permease protein